MNKQREAFCLALAAGMSDIDAYYKAGYKPRDRRQAGKLASRLKTFADIRTRLTELTEKAKAEAEEKAVMSMKERRAKLSSFARQEVDVNGDKVTAKEARMAIDLLNKMDGVYKERVELSGSIDFGNIVERARGRIDEQ